MLLCDAAWTKTSISISLTIRTLCMKNTLQKISSSLFFRWIFCREGRQHRILQLIWPNGTLHYPPLLRTATRKQVISVHLRTLLVGHKFARQCYINDSTRCSRRCQWQADSYSSFPVQTSAKLWSPLSVFLFLFYLICILLVCFFFMSPCTDWRVLIDDWCCLLLLESLHPVHSQCSRYCVAECPCMQYHIRNSTESRRIRNALL